MFCFLDQLSCFLDHFAPVQKTPERTEINQSAAAPCWRFAPKTIRPT